MALIASLMLTPTASASGPGSKQTGPAHPDVTLQSTTWLAAKNSYRVVSGIQANQGKHGKANPTILSTALFDLSSQTKTLAVSPNYPSVPGEPYNYTLYQGWGIEYAAEPSDGSHPNLPDGTQYTDDAGNTYNDYWYVTLCGPGAADVALYYWPYPSNDATHTVSDPLPGNGPYGGNHTSGALTWYGQDGSGGGQAYRLRGYMAYLAFGLGNVPAWTGSGGIHRVGMLDESYWQTGIVGGATLQATEEAMNWEASSENSSDWANYFYTVAWNSTYNGNIGVTLHNDIVTDIANSHVAVVAEVNGHDLPDWTTSGFTKHFIAIVGYDDNTQEYYYVDTCKVFAGCHDAGGVQGDTPDIHPISQSQLTTAVSDVQTDQATGDGGWIW